MTRFVRFGHIVRMKLKEWLETKEISVPEFAKMIGVKGVRSVYRYIDEERIPEKEVMKRIKKATKGVVTADSFYQ